MEIRLETQGFELTDALAAAAREQVIAALGRMGGSVMYVDVFMRDVNGPKGGPDKHVLLRIRLIGSGVIAVDSQRSEWRAALAVCARRARRCVRRSLRRRRRLEKGRIREFHGRQSLGDGLHST